MNVFCEKIDCYKKTYIFVILFKYGQNENKTVFLLQNYSYGNQSKYDFNSKGSLHCSVILHGKVGKNHQYEKFNVRWIINTSQESRCPLA